MFENLNFSYQSYQHILQSLKDCHYSTMLIGEIPTKNKKLFLRHDVDVDYLGVIPLAQIEFSLGMKSSWFFLPNSAIYNLCADELIVIIKKLDKMGHQIGLHIDASQYRSIEEMIIAIDSFYNFFSSFIPLSRTLSFHKPAPWLLNDIVIQNWVNAYQDEFYSEVMYVSDSNRREFWKENRIQMAVEENKSLTLLTHPLWWKSLSYDQDSIVSYSCNVLGNEKILAYLSRTCKIFEEIKIL